MNDIYVTFQLVYVGFGVMFLSCVGYLTYIGYKILQLLKQAYPLAAYNLSFVQPLKPKKGRQ